MRKRYRKLIYFFLSILILCFTVQGLSRSIQLDNQKIPLEKTGPGSRKWAELLKAFETHTEESKLFITKLAQSKDCAIEKKLAAFLLDEWDADQESQHCTIPRIIYQEPFRLDKNRVIQGGAYVFLIETDSMGKLINVDFLRTPNDAYVKNIILESLKKSYFIPPFINGKFTAGKGTITIFIDVK